MSFKTRIYGNGKDLLIRIPTLDITVLGLKSGDIVEVDLDKLHLPKKKK